MPDRATLPVRSKGMQFKHFLSILLNWLNRPTRAMWETGYHGLKRLMS
jgi:hypothetical protein